MEPRAWSLLRIRALHVALARIAHAFGGAPTEWLRGYAEGALHAIDAASAIEDRAALARWIDAHEAAHARVSGAALPAPGCASRRSSGPPPRCAASCATPSPSSRRTRRPRPTTRRARRCTP